jgi:Bacterial protein of unknown function (Gcw_chp)
MPQTREIWRGVLLLAVLATPAPLAGQVVLTSDAGAFNNYTWRGVTMTNKLVVQPDAYLSVPGGGGSAILGVWGNIDAGRYDDPVKDLSEGGGTAGFDATEIDVWAEYGHPLGSTFSGTLGGLLYLFPNEAGLTNEANRTFEVYGKLQATGLPLAPKVAAYLDVAKVNGLYLETSLTHTLSRLKGFPITFGALAGWSAGQALNRSDPTEVANFASDGLTHLDLSATGALAAGPVTLAPTAHLVIPSNAFAEVTRPGVTHDLKGWLGLTLTWAKPLTPAPITQQ